MAGKPGDDRTSFGALIREERRRRRWTQEDLAVAANVGVRTIIRWENNQTRPEPEQLRAVVEALRLDHDLALSTLGWRDGDDEYDGAPTLEQAENYIRRSPALSDDEKDELVAFLRVRRAQRATG